MAQASECMCRQAPMVHKDSLSTSSDVMSGGPRPALTVTICGGGNGAHMAAAYLGTKHGITVNVLTRRPHLWQRRLRIKTEGSSWAFRGTLEGTLNIVSADAAAVVPQSDMVIVISPAHTVGEILKKIASSLQRGQVLGSLFCQGGFDWAVWAVLGEKAEALDGFWGLLNIPWICTVAEHGRAVRLIGPKRKLQLSSFPPEKGRDFGRLVAALFDIHCEVVPNFLSLTLTPSNQIIHPARCYGIFHKWDGKSAMSQDEIQWGLYSEMDDLSVEWLEKLDKELQSIRSALVQRYPALDLTAVIPIGQRIISQYGNDVTDTSSLKMIFASNLSYRGCKTPVLPSPDGAGFIPNLESRLFWEDIPFGLCALKSIAQLLELETPSIDFLIRWHQQFMDKMYLSPDGKLNPAHLREMATVGTYGIESVDQLVKPCLLSNTSRRKGSNGSLCNAQASRTKVEGTILNAKS